jgi:dolichyl-phosphate-mannose-protein mannosyltransferase
MMQSNNALVPDADKEDIIASKPMDWPFLYLGMRMNGWGDHQTKWVRLGFIGVADMLAGTTCLETR